VLDNWQIIALGSIGCAAIAFVLWAYWKGEIETGSYADPALDHMKRLEDDEFDVEVHNARRLYVATRKAAEIMMNNRNLLHDSQAIAAVASRPIDIEIGGKLNLLYLVQHVVEAWESTAPDANVDRHGMRRLEADPHFHFRPTIETDLFQPLAVAGNGNVLRVGDVQAVIEELEDPNCDAARLLRYMSDEMARDWHRANAEQAAVDRRSMLDLPVKTLESIAAEGQAANVLRDIESKPPIDLPELSVTVEGCKTHCMKTGEPFPEGYTRQEAGCEECRLEITDD